MTIDQLRTVAKAEPFKPLTVSLTDGRRVFVPHPEFVWVPPRASRTSNVAGEAEDRSIVDLLHVTSIDSGNGAHGRRKRAEKGKK